MNTQPTPETDEAGHYQSVDGYEVVLADFARKLERERDELKRWASVNGVIDLQRELNEKRAESIRWMSIAEGRGRTDEDEQLATITAQRDRLAEILGDLKTLAEITEQRDEAREQRDRLAEQIEANHKGALMLERMVYQAREQCSNLDDQVSAAMMVIRGLERERDRFVKACDQYSEDEILCKLHKVTEQKMVSCVESERQLDRLGNIEYRDVLRLSGYSLEEIDRSKQKDRIHA